MLELNFATLRTQALLCSFSRTIGPRSSVPSLGPHVTGAPRRYTMAGDSFRIHFLFSEWSTYSTRDSRFFSFSPFWPLDSVHVHSKRCHDEAWRWSATSAADSGCEFYSSLGRAPALSECTHKANGYRGSDIFSSWQCVVANSPPPIPYELPVFCPFLSLLLLFS
jgi:hypothetical protein